MTVIYKNTEDGSVEILNFSTMKELTKHIKDFIFDAMGDDDYKPQIRSQANSKWVVYYDKSFGLHHAWGVKINAN